MSKTYSLGLTLSLATMLLASAVLAQQAGAPPKTGCEPDSCVSKVFYLPSFSTAFELQEVVNTLRTIANFRYIDPNQSEHNISLKGTPQQLAFAGKLVSVLEKFHASGSHARSSVLVYQFKGPESETAAAARILEHSPQRASTICELNTCFVEALYLPDLSEDQLYALLSRIRSNTDMTRIVPSSSSHLILFQGTAEQVAFAEKLAND